MSQPSEPVGSSTTIKELHGDNPYAIIARKTWLGDAKKVAVKPRVVNDEIWTSLKKDGFSLSALSILENLQLLERYLWPGYDDDSSNNHVILLVLMANVKKRESLSVWESFTSKPSHFSSFFRRVLSLTIDESVEINIRTHVISFIITAFQSLDNPHLRKECAPLVSIGIWHNLHSQSVREQIFEKNPSLRKPWKAQNKRYDAADDDTKSKLRFDRFWLFTLVLDFLNRTYDIQSNYENVRYCERFTEFLNDLQSQLPTRRYVNTLLQNLLVLPVVKLSPMFSTEGNGLFCDLFKLLRHYTFFQIDDHSGQPLSDVEFYKRHCSKLAKLQGVAFKHFKEKLTILALSNFGSLDKRKDLESHFSSLGNSDLKDLCAYLGIRSHYPSGANVVQDRAFLIDILVSAHEKRPTLRESVRNIPILPTERILYEDSFLRNDHYNGTKPLAIPKLNLQYLSIADFLWRSFILHRCECFYEIRSHLEDVIKRVQPKFKESTIHFDGFSRMALPLQPPTILNVMPPRVGETVPASVRAEVVLDVSRLNPSIRQEWESLKPDDVLYILSVQPGKQPSGLSNGHSAGSQAEKMGLRYLRCAEVVQVQDDHGNPLRERGRPAQENQRRPRHRKLILRLDPKSYSEDTDESTSSGSVYQSMNLIVRRKARENNFKPVLESIKQLTTSDVPMPGWLQDVFLGYGDPAGATYKRLANKLEKIDFRDTFLDWSHLLESLPTKFIEPDDTQAPNFGPPYVIAESANPVEGVPPPRPSKKRRRDDADADPQEAKEIVKVSTYRHIKSGPYPTDAPRPNTVRFTPAQVEAIVSGTQPGLTVIVGPPGTGKTDVATQIINNLYHNFPAQRILLIARSNQALNQLFQKIIALDIDERHLLRLGHGEDELEAEGDYSKYGRVESFLENGARYLAEVNRLATNLGAPGAHGNSCETADYFNVVYVKPAWSSYWDSVQSGKLDLEQIIEKFPFHQYFSDAPQPIFAADASKEDIIITALGCYRHIEKVFSELEDMRPFEILRNPKDRANYLLIKEARIVAMTSTHAAMRRQEIARLGFHYDNVVMEEAAQITEIETFIPLALQNAKGGDMPLQRVILCGDHLQNSPIIQNLAFGQFSNLEQSLFLRLIRLGVPTINLDRQGRARPEIAELYSWRYHRLGNLPTVETGAEYKKANAGFRFDYQFISVPDYKGRGETQPTPHFIQNLGEAEYAVAIYMYMRLLEYPASKISILTTYAGQKALVKDVLHHRCSKNGLFGLPRIVTTVDKYQGEQNDYIILSLTRTNQIGYLRDIRRMTVALSRARLGLYILGRREIFEANFELKEVFDRLSARPDKLSLVTNEMYPTSRLLDSLVDATEMESVEHLGQYVYEMTQAKVAALQANGGTLTAAQAPAEDVEMDDDDDEDAAGKNEISSEEPNGEEIEQQEHVENTTDK